MTSQIQISKKLADDSIVVIGGEDAATFTANVQAILGAEQAEAVLRTFDSLAPVSAGSYQPPAQPQYQPPTAQQVQQQFPGSQQVATPAPEGAPGPAPIGKNGRPMRWVPPGVSKKTNRPYAGFWGEDNPR